MKSPWLMLSALLLCFCALACTKRQPKSDAVFPDQPQAANPPEKPAPPKARALTNWDRAHRQRYRSLSEVDLHSELVKIGIDQFKNIKEPDYYVWKAMVAEELTKFDAERGTNHWDRAYVHYSEAIEHAQALVDSPEGQRYVERIAQLKYYRSRPATMLGKHKEATEDRNAALANAVVQKQIQQAEDGPQDD